MRERLLGAPVTTTNLALRYLSPNRVGPVRATPRLVGVSHAGDGARAAATFRIDLTDRGAGGRTTVTASATVERADAIVST